MIKEKTPEQIGNLLLRGGFSNFDDAQATAVIVNGSITGITFQNNGSGYTDTTQGALTFTGGSGSGATAVPMLGSGYVVSATITNAGSLYTLPPIVTVNLGGGDTTGNGATFVTQINAGKVVQVICTSAGNGKYTRLPTLAFAAATGDTTGTGAAATAIAAFSVTGATISAGGSGYGTSGTAAPIVAFTTTPSIAIVQTSANRISFANPPVLVSAQKSSTETIAWTYPPFQPSNRVNPSFIETGSISLNTRPGAASGIIAFTRAGTLTVGAAFAFSYEGY